MADLAPAPPPVKCSQTAPFLAPQYSTLFNEDPSPSSATCNGVNDPYEEGLKYTKDSGIHHHQSHSHDSMIIQKHQDMVNHHSMGLSFVVEASREAQCLRQGNSQLRAMKQLSLFIQASLCHTTPFDIAHGFCIGGAKEKENSCADWNNVSKDQQEVSEENNNNGVEVERFSLPKSISVLSNGYLKMGQPAGNWSRTEGAARSRSSSGTPPEVVVRTRYAWFILFYF